LKDNFNSGNPRSIQVNFKATLLVGGEGNDGEYGSNGDMGLPMPKGKMKLQAI